MPQLPVLSGRKVVRAFEKHGWEIARQRGSHIIMVNRAERDPFHPRPQRSCQRNTSKSHPLGGPNRSGILLIKPETRQQLAQLPFEEHEIKRERSGR